MDNFAGLKCLAAGALVWLCACGHARDAARPIDSALAWSDSAQALATRWHTGAAPSAEVTGALASLHQRLQQARFDVQKSAPESPARPALTVALSTTARSVILLDSAVAHSDTAAVVRISAELASQRRTLVGLQAALKR